MNENIEAVKKYNLWFGNTIDSGFPRPLYTASIGQYLGCKVVKVLTGQRRVGKSYILRQTAMHLMQQGVNGNNIVFINRELTAFDFIENYKELDFVAIKNDRTLYVQATYMLIDEQTIEREYAPLECIADNYEKIVVSLDDLQLPSRNGIKHIRAWELSQML